MNSIAGKSTGIALLMAAALIAALFAMGVFSANGVGADGHFPTAEITDENDPVTETQNDDSLTITVSGLSGVGANAANDIVITMPGDLGTVDDVELSWEGDDQNAETITSPTYANGVYTFSFPGTATINRGAATMVISLAENARVDTNTIITAITIGRGDAGDATLNTVELPKDGLAITGASTGPSIALDPSIVAVFVGDEAATDDDAYSVEVSGTNFESDADVILSATDPDGTEVDLTPDVGGDTVTVSSDDITNGEYTEEVTIAAQTSAVRITITAMQTVDTVADSVTAVFAVNTAPTFEETYDDLSFAADATDAVEVEVEAIDADDDDLTYSAESDDTDVATVTVDGDTVTVTPVGSGTAAITVTATDEVAKDTTTFNATVADPPEPPSVGLSSQVPGAAVQVTIKANVAAAIEPNQDITVDLSAFTVPSSIADAAIDIASGGYNGSPNNVVVSGKKVTMTVPTVKANGNDQDLDVMGNYTIKIKQSAGIENPAAGGEKTVKWQENAPDGHEKEAEETIHRVVKVSEDDGTRGTESTATLLGFANGTATVRLNGEKLAEVTIADNTGTLELDTSSSDYKANREDGDGNVITAVDAAGKPQDVMATFTIKPNLALDPTETVVSKSVTLSLSDWPVKHEIMSVQIGSTGVDLPDANTDTDAHNNPTTGDDGTVSFSVTIPAGVNRGSQTVKATGESSTDTATATLKVGVLSLKVEPDTAVPGQEVTIQGSGFKAGDILTSLSIGGTSVSIPDNNKTASSNGDIVITVNVPSPAGSAIGSGTKTVTVEALSSTQLPNNSNRVAEGEVEVPEASITLSPESSRRGTTVSVSGSGFPSGDLVQVQYDRDGTPITVTAKAADSAGNVEVDFVVPSYAKIGSKHDVQAMSVGVYATVTASDEHETPGAVITLSPDRVPNGSQLTISGMNFPAFATVAEMTVGGVDVRPVPAPATSIDGDFSATVLVPQMELGNQSVSVRVAQTTFTTFIQIVEATEEAVTDPAELFASLGNRLVRVWYLERSTQVWSFYDPDPDVAAFNTLTEVSSGQNVSIITSSGESVEFQGMTLYQGTNPIALK